MVVITMNEGIKAVPNTSKNRLGYVDAVRVFAMVMVILLHCICDYSNHSGNFGRPLWWMTSFLNELTRTGVPLFFMISGFLLIESVNISDIGKFYKRRFSKVAVPFLIYNVFYYCYFKIRSGENLLDGQFFTQLVNNGSAYHLWFMYSLLLLYLFVPFIRMISEKATPKILILFFVLTIFQTTLKPFFNILFGGKVYFFFAEDGVVGYMGYAVLGYILGKYEIKWDKAIITLGLLAIPVFAVANFYGAIQGDGFVFSGGYTLNHYIEAAAMFLLFKNLNINKNKVLSLLSVLSFRAYLIHVFVIELFKPVFDNLSPSVMMLAMFVLSLVLSFGWAYVVECFYKIIRGKKLKKDRHTKGVTA